MKPCYFFEISLARLIMENNTHNKQKRNEKISIRNKTNDIPTFLPVLGEEILWSTLYVNKFDFLDEMDKICEDINYKSSFKKI